MARTILEIAQEAAGRDATAPRPSTLFGSTNDRVAMILRHAAKDTIREYLRSNRAQGLSEFHSTWSFALRPGQFAYPLPPDYLRMIPNTEHLGGWPLGLVGPASPQVWSWWRASHTSSAGPTSWRIRNNTIHVMPTPAAADLVQVDYVSRYPVVSLVKAEDLTITGGHPLANLPLVPRDGHVTQGALEVSTSLPGDDDFLFEAPPGFDDGVWSSDPYEVLDRLNLLSGAEPLPMLRRPEFTADSDMPAFDDDYLLSLGMTFRLRRALGLNYAEHAAEYAEELDRKETEDAGGPRPFVIGRDDCEASVVPLGNGKWLVS